MSPSSSSRQCSPVVAAMRNLRASGERSFEELVARLLSRVSGERIRRCRAGSQGGVDAIAEVPFALETKRYSTQLNERDLVGGLTQAAGAYRDLQLWVLAATCEVAAQTEKTLIDAGSRQGIAVLILDTKASEPNLPGVDSLAALAATDVGSVMEVLADPTWRVRGRKPNLIAIEATLQGIRRMPSFAAWEERLRNDLRDLPTWHRLVRSQNERLLSLILSDAGNAFGTPYDESRAVSRSVETELTQWAESSLTSKAAEVAVVAGDRYDGKTTLVYRWLSDALRKLPVPVFFFSSRDVQSKQGDLETLVLREAREALGRFADQANILIERQRRWSREHGGAWCIMILDGANEYVTDPRARSTAVVWAIPPQTRSIDDHQTSTEIVQATRRHCALLVTCRTRDLEEDSSWLGASPRCRVSLGAYDDREFADALTRRNLGPNDIAGLPQSAAAMIRHPRYLDLMLRHREELGQFSAITADVLHYLDASDKVPSPARLNPDAFKAFLRGLAENWKTQQQLNYSTLRNQVREVTENVDASIAVLISEGVFNRDGESFVLDRERLALGMGLFIRESLLHLSEGARAEKLKDILEPHPDDDEKVRWLRAAVTTSVLVGDAAKNPGMVDHLLATWLSSRNFSQNDLDDVKSLSTLLIEPMLRVVSADSVDISVLLLAQAMIETEMPRHKKVISAAIRRWFRLVPTDTFFQGEEEGRNEAERVARAASESSLRDLDLRLTTPEAGKSIRTRHRLGLSVVCAHASGFEPIDLLALIAARGVTYWNLNDGELFAVRILLANAARTWFEKEVASQEQIADASRSAFLRDLIQHSERADLIELQSRLPALQTIFEWPGRLSRAELRALDGTQGEKDILHTAVRAGGLVLDPDCPPPPRAWRLKLAKAAIGRFGASPKLHAGRGRTLDDLDLENLEPALAAWVPEAGARIVHSFLADIPRRIAAGEESWSWALEENASLLTPADRRQLLDLILAMPEKESGLQHALRRGYLCAMAAGPPSERLRLLLDHPFANFEWTKFYEVLAMSGDDRLRTRTIAVVREEHDPRRLKRARYFLANQGGWEASPTDLSRLISDLSEDDANRNAQDATHTLLRYSRIPTTTSASALGPLVHVANSLSKEAWQYAAFLDTKRNPGVRGAEWIARARSAVLTARHNGAEGHDDDGVVAQGIQRLAVRIEHRLTQPASGHSEQFADGIADEINNSAFESFVDHLLGLGDRRRVDTGVLIPFLRRALKTRHPSAKALWALAYPFQRSRVSVNVRIVVQGLDWTVVDIHDPASDDGLARELLVDLISDCRSDSELISIAMGARLESLVRLTAVVNQLLDDDDEIDRARARFVAGWMPENARLRKRLTAPDRSCWVDRIGREAVCRLDREKWAREWLGRFLAEKRRPHRWAAGRLFLACSDAATPFWAHNVLRDSEAPSSRRAEGVLLLGRIRKKVDESELRDKFLGYSVRDLSEVVQPWHKPIRWENIDVTPVEAT